MARGGERDGMKSKDTHIFVGTFPLGFENVELYALAGTTDGYFYCRPDDKSPGRIKVGIGTKEWDQVVSVLLHETFEMLCAKLRLRYEATGVCGDHASYLFVMNHCQFVDLCQSQASFITLALPKLAEVWRKQRRKK